MGARLDHITVAADELARGAAWTASRLGCAEIPPGGAHPRMGTHNRLLRLGEASFLEVIAIDPAVPTPPRRPRWFGLDEPTRRRALAEKGPRLAMWVANTRDVAAVAARSAIPLGVPERVQRGDLEWSITIPEDGSLPLDGLMPTLIEWPEGPHPASRMVDLGFRLERLDIATPQARRLEAALDAIELPHGRGELVHVAEAALTGLTARIRAPDGSVKTLEG